MKTVVLKDRFPQIIAQLPLRVGLATRAGARLVAATAKELAPVGTGPDSPHPGRLRDSIRVEDRRDTEDGGWAVSVPAMSEPWSGHPVGMPYAHLVEFGSVHNDPPQPFLIPATEVHREEVPALVAAALKGL
jgi:HK97 gp10 family phage protein